MLGAGVYPGQAPAPALNNPVWVQLVDPGTGQFYFHNVETGERSDVDPDPEGELLCRAENSAASTELPSHVRPQPAAAHPAFPFATTGDVVAAAGRARTGGKKGADEDTEFIMEHQAWWLRPARQQVKSDAGKVQYIQGHEDFNVWFGKAENDRFNKKERDPAQTRCNPATDTGWTSADTPGAQDSHFCMFFAKGSCNLGFRCSYYHRIPTPADAKKCDMVHDIFGRQKHREPRDDMGGVGCLHSPCDTVFVGDLFFDRTRVDAIQEVEQDIHQAFGEWGEIQQVRVIPSKALGFVRYKYRASAEFAMIAMNNQRLGKSQCIKVKWANADPNPRAEKARRIERQDMVDAAVDNRIAGLGLSDSELAGMQLANAPRDFKDVVAPYPDTSAQYPGVSKTPGMGPVTSHWPPPKWHGPRPWPRRGLPRSRWRRTRSRGRPRRRPA
ncbi:unnamed protein product [Prorocentrum cordatum]|uniref:Pre-mRNA-splicing factor RBM22 n=1 Tax=Prorocentrum cordatum TaxID=2364126 RepID=A0ABN9SMN3_9DINO|nr:unnamed protein product [Polarella glacialis]